MKALNIGCHDIHIENVINLDNDPTMKPDIVMDCTKLQENFEQESVDFVYAGHFLEHFEVPIGKKIAKDIFQILKPYGVLIATVPDYSKCMKMGIAEAERIIIAEGDHKSLMNIERLKDYLKEAGFLTVIEAKPWEIAHCPFPRVEWQTSVVGIKHPPVSFRGIK